MGASTTTGSGVGDAGKLSVKDLNVLANGVAIMWAGSVETDDGTVPTSPPSYSAIVNLPAPLPGGHAAYGVFLTTIDAGEVYLSGKMNNSDGNFYRFLITSAVAGEVQFMVVRFGLAPELIVKGRTS